MANPIADGEFPILRDRVDHRVTHEVVVLAQDRRHERTPRAVVAPRLETDQRLELRRPDAVLLDRVPAPRTHATRGECEARFDRALAQLVLALDPRGDVDRDTHPLANGAGLVEHRCAAAFDPTHLAVTAQYPMLHHEIGLTGGGPFDGGGVELAIFRVDRADVRLEVTAEGTGLHPVEPLELGGPDHHIGRRVPAPRTHLTRGERQASLDVTVVRGSPRARGHLGSHTPYDRTSNR